MNSDEPTTPKGERQGARQDDRTAAPSTGGLYGADQTLPAAAAIAAPQVRLGGFRLLEVIGQGGMGVVYRAEDSRLGRHVAVKVMKPESAADPELRERFLREARSQAAIEHDHVAPVFAADEDQGVPFLVMPLLRGETLASRLARGKLPLAEAMRIGRETALGVAAAHRRGLIHRDIKPGNIWLEENGRARLMDFGLARELLSPSGTTQSGAMIGTPLYMAPEQTRGEPIDERADLFSLGCVLYELAGGVRPFAAGDVQSVLERVRDSEPTPLRELDASIPPRLETLIGEMLSKDPSRRPASAQHVANALASIDGSLPHGRRSWLTPAAVLAAALACVGAIAIGAVLILNWPRANSRSTPDNFAGSTTAKQEFPPLDEAWAASLAGLSRPAQIDALRSEMMRRNPGYDGELIDEYWNDARSVKLTFRSRRIVDLTPVRAIPGLEALECDAGFNSPGALQSIEPLRGMKLAHLQLSFNPVRDLSPLEGMPIVNLWATELDAADLSAVYSLPAQVLHVTSRRKDARVDAAKLLDKPLVDVWLEPEQTDNFERLREIETLEQINGQPAAEFWKSYSPQP
jgi:serine/threonine protein kinase